MYIEFYHNGHVVIPDIVRQPIRDEHEHEHKYNLHQVILFAINSQTTFIFEMIKVIKLKDIVIVVIRQTPRIIIAWNDGVIIHSATIGVYIDIDIPDLEIFQSYCVEDIAKFVDVTNWSLGNTKIDSSVINDCLKC